MTRTSTKTSPFPIMGPAVSTCDFTRVQKLPQKIGRGPESGLEAEKGCRGGLDLLAEEG
jgi:hypothetical protein